MIVYLDILFLTNFFINYMILIIVSIWASIYTKKYRIFLSALVGAIYSMFMFFEVLNFIYNMIFKILIGVLLCLIAYGKRNLLKVSITFFIVSFCFAGSLLGLLYISKNPNYLLSNGVPYLEISINLLISMVILCYILLCNVLKGLATNKILSEKTKEISINVLDNTIKVCAFLDTGNLLFDDVTGKPIIIVENYIFESELDLQFLSLDNPIDIINFNKTFGNMLKLRIIYYKSLGSSDNMMVILTPNEILDDKGKKIDYLIGISNKNIDIAGCQAIMGV